MSPKDDWMPERFFTEPVGSEGHVLDRDEFKELMGEYCCLNGYELPVK